MRRLWEFIRGQIRGVRCTCNEDWTRCPYVRKEARDAGISVEQLDSLDPLD